MRIRHPYNFVPFADKLERKAWPELAGHDRWQPGLDSGTLRCKLEARSMLSIRRHFETLKEARQAPYIPGSSLRGMVRNLAQMLGAGCGLLFEDRTEDPKHKLARKRGDTKAKPRPRTKPDLGEFHPCTMEEACLVCRVFGYAPTREESGEGEEERLSGWAGKVRFHDSKRAENWSDDCWRQPPEGTAQWQAQGTWHTAFYFPDGNKPYKPAGWKAYLHAKRVIGAHPDYRPEACVPSGTVFEFDVEYENLTVEELAVFRFALALEHQCEHHNVTGLCHKLGYGKPIGLGSAKISIGGFTPLSVGRYFGEEAPKLDDPGCAIHKYLEMPGFQALQEFLSWENRPDEIRYPGYKWFRQKPTDSIDDYEKAVDKEAAAREPGKPVLAVPREPPAPQEPAEVKIPKKLEVRITSVSGGKTRFETVETYAGDKYTGVAANTLYQAQPGDRCELKVDSVDRKNRRLTGRISWRT